METIRAALHECRQALDRELEAAGSAAERATGLRRDPYTPSWITEYPDVEAFIAEDRRRALPDYPARRDAGGADYGSNWTLEDEACPWLVTRWRISWLSMSPFGADRDEPTLEVYAYELIPGQNRREDEPIAGRVWLLGHLREHRWLDDQLDQALKALPRPVREGRNSLLASVEAIRTLIDAESGENAAAA